MKNGTISPTPVFETTRNAVLTPKGDAVRLLYQLVNLLGVLPDDDRQAVRELLAAELDD